MQDFFLYDCFFPKKFQCIFQKINFFFKLPLYLPNIPLYKQKIPLWMPIITLYWLKITLFAQYNTVFAKLLQYLPKILLCLPIISLYLPKIPLYGPDWSKRFELAHYCPNSSKTISQNNFSWSNSRWDDSS